MSLKWLLKKQTKEKGKQLSPLLLARRPSSPTSLLLPRPGGLLAEAQLPLPTHNPISSPSAHSFPLPRGPVSPRAVPPFL